jgi:hypothetical protein
MDSRKAPVSKEVRRPETSRREIGPAWRMVTEKFVGCTVRTPSAGEVILPVRGKPWAENFYAKEDRCGPAVFTDAQGICRPHLWAHDHAQAPAPAFSKPHAHDLRFRRETIPELVRCWTKSQRGRNQINQRRSLLQGHPRQIAIASDLSASAIAGERAASNPRPEAVSECARWLQFHDRWLSQPRHGEEVEDALFAACTGKNRRVVLANLNNPRSGTPRGWLAIQPRIPWQDYKRDTWLEKYVSYAGQHISNSSTLSGPRRAAGPVAPEGARRACVPEPWKYRRSRAKTR